MTHLQERDRLIKVRVALALLHGCHVSTQPVHDAVRALRSELVVLHGALGVEGGDVRPPGPGNLGVRKHFEQAQLPAR